MKFPKAKPWEWILWALAAGFLAFSIVGCAGLAKAWGEISENAFRILIGVAAGIAVAALTGIPIMPAASGGAAASAATILSEPECPPQTVIQTTGTVNANGGGPGGASAFQLALIGLALYWLVRNRAHVADIFKGRAYGRKLRTLAHTLLGGASPK